jgi:hypothetical protein
MVAASLSLKPREHRQGLMIELLYKYQEETEKAELYNRVMEIVSKRRTRADGASKPEITRRSMVETTEPLCVHAKVLGIGRLKKSEAGPLNFRPLIEEAELYNRALKYYNKQMTTRAPRAMNYYCTISRIAVVLRGAR